MTVFHPRNGPAEATTLRRARGEARCVPGRATRWVPWLLVSLVAIGCQPGLPVSSSAQVTAWLTCIECVDGELDSLKVLAAQHPWVVDTLISAMLRGPSSNERAHLSAELRASYPEGQHLRMDSIVYTQKYTEYAVASYQARAAIALATIGGTVAVQALDSAWAMPPDSFPDYVRYAIQFARDSILGP